MKVYFTGSLHNKDITRKTYTLIVSTLEKMGHEVKAPVLETERSELDQLQTRDRVKFYKRLKRMMNTVDVIVGEVSYPSTINIGHEASLALDLAKPFIGLYQEEREPGLLQGIGTDKLILLEYNEKDLKAVLTYALEEAGEHIDVRFNFFISPQISSYLDHIAKEEKVPRSVYLRQLIDKAMEEDEEYQETQ